MFDQVVLNIWYDEKCSIHEKDTNIRLALVDPSSEDSIAFIGFVHGLDFDCLILDMRGWYEDKLVYSVSIQWIQQLKRGNNTYL